MTKASNSRKVRRLQAANTRPHKDAEPVSVTVELGKVGLDVMAFTCPTCSRRASTQWLPGLPGQVVPPDIAKQVARGLEVGATCECGQRLVLSMRRIVLAKN